MRNSGIILLAFEGEQIFKNLSLNLGIVSFFLRELLIPQMVFYSFKTIKSYSLENLDCVELC